MKQKYETKVWNKSMKQVFEAWKDTKEKKKSLKH